MPIEKLDDVNLRATQLGAMINWYRAALGLRTGDRPNCPFSGAWMAAGDTVMLPLGAPHSKSSFNPWVSVTSGLTLAQGIWANSFRKWRKPDSSDAESVVQQCLESHTGAE